ncbi:diguanylate cyclase domain-containing protein [Sessilibacter sp. MAH4]
MNINTALLTSILDKSPSHIAVVDSTGEIVYVNKSWINFGRENGKNNNQWIGLNYLNISQQSAQIGDALAAKAHLGLSQVISGECDEFTLDYPCHSDTVKRWFLMRAQAHEVHGLRLVIIYHDQHAAGSELEAIKERLMLATDVAQMGIWEWRPSDNSLIWDHWMYEIFEIQPTDTSGYLWDWINQIDTDDKARVKLSLIDASNRKIIFNTEYKIHTESGVKILQSRACTIEDKENHSIKVVGVTQDITHHRLAEQKIQILAYHDQLTQLPNRRLLNDRLNQALAAYQRNHLMGALVFIDLDNFKIINDSYGHKIGDLALTKISETIRQYLRSKDTLARFGGDEFVLLIPELSNNTRDAKIAVEALLKRLISQLEKPIFLADISVTVTASFGITFYYAGNQDHTELLKQADEAMYQIKRKGKSSYAFYHQPPHNRKLINSTKIKLLNTVKQK